MNTLEILLKEKKWKQADAETANIILSIANRKDACRYLSDEEWKDFPCQDLEMINHLWTNYSRGRFGFSIQKTIYQSFGVTQEYEPEAWRRFRTALGWNEQGRPDYYSLAAPKGRFPVLGRLVDTGVCDDWGDIWHYYGWDATILRHYYSEITGFHTTKVTMHEAHRRFSFLMSKLESCNINTRVGSASYFNERK